MMTSELEVVEASDALENDEVGVEVVEAGCGLGNDVELTDTVPVELLEVLAVES